MSDFKNAAMRPVTGLLHTSANSGGEHVLWISNLSNNGECYRLTKAAADCCKMLVETKKNVTYEEIVQTLLEKYGVKNELIIREELNKLIPMLIEKISWN